MNKKKPVRQPFRSGPPQQGKQSYSGGGGRKVVFTKKADYGYQQRQNSSGKYTSQRGIILQHVCNAPRPRDIQSNTPCNKRVIFRKNSTCKHGGKASLFCQKLAITNSGSKCPVYSEGLQAPIFKGAMSTQVTPCSKNECTKSSTGTTGDNRHVEERCHSQSFSCTGGIFKQPIFSGQKGWGSQTSDKSEAPECLHPIPTFQDGGSPSVEGLVARRRLHV